MGFYDDHCAYFLPMTGWFVFSALLSAYNKTVFGSGNMAFPCPLLLTSIHFLLQWIFSWVLCSIFPVFLGGDVVQAMSWGTFLGTSLPCGLVTSGDVGLSNLSLVRISLTFYTMVKASSPIFVMLWAYIFAIERITWSLIVVVMVIAMGEFLTVLGEVSFDVAGFTLCLAASCLSGARWTLVQLKIQSLDPPLTTMIATMRVLSPSMFFSMLAMSLAVEKPWEKLGEGYFDNTDDCLKSLSLGALGGVIAIAMIMCEFYLIMHASAIILMIGGVIKELITIFVGVYRFDDTLTRINIWGCATVFLGVLLYKIHFHLARKKTAGEVVVIDTGTTEKEVLLQPIAVLVDEASMTINDAFRPVKRHMSDDNMEILLDEFEKGEAEASADLSPDSPRELELAHVRRRESGDYEHSSP